MAAEADWPDTAVEPERADHPHDPLARHDHERVDGRSDGSDGHHAAARIGKREEERAYAQKIIREPDLLVPGGRAEAEVEEGTEENRGLRGEL